MFGAALDGNNHADTPTAIAAAYDPEADTWRLLPPSELSPQAMTAAWLDDELIAWDYDQASAAYDPIDDVWRPLERVPLAFSECRPVSVATVDTMFGEFCGKTVALSAGEVEWHRIPIPLPTETRGGCCWVFEPVVAGDVVLVPSHLYGMQLEALERRMFVYNPPPLVRTDPMGEVLDPEPFLPPTERDGDLLADAGDLPGRVGGDARVPDPARRRDDGRSAGRDVFVRRERTRVRSCSCTIRTRRSSDSWIRKGLRCSSTHRWADSSCGPLGVTTSIPGSDSSFRRGRCSSRSRSRVRIVRSSGPVWPPAWPVPWTSEKRASGFPIVGASGEAELAEGFGEAGGAQLAFGDAAADPDMVSQLDATIFLSPDGCDPATVDASSGGCLGGGTRVREHLRWS